MKEEAEAVSDVDANTPTQVVVARNEAAMALADVRHSLESLRDSGQATLIQVRRKVGPVLVAGAIASVALLCVVYLLRRDRPRLLAHAPARPSYLASTVRAVVLSVARVALVRVVERLTARIAQQGRVTDPHMG